VSWLCSGFQKNAFLVGLSQTAKDCCLAALFMVWAFSGARMQYALFFDATWIFVLEVFGICPDEV